MNDNFHTFGYLFFLLVAMGVVKLIGYEGILRTGLAVVIVLVACYIALKFAWKIDAAENEWSSLRREVDRMRRDLDQLQDKVDEIRWSRD